MTLEPSCKEVRSLAFEYRRGELGEPARAPVDEHLAGCAACRTYVGNVGGLLGAAAADVALSAATIDRLWTEIEAALPTGAPRPTLRRRTWLAAAAIGAIALAGGVLLDALLDAERPELTTWIAMDSPVEMPAAPSVEPSADFELGKVAPLATGEAIANEPSPVTTASMLEEAVVAEPSRELSMAPQAPVEEPVVTIVHTERRERSRQREPREEARATDSEAPMERVRESHAMVRQSPDAAEERVTADASAMALAELAQREGRYFDAIAILEGIIDVGTSTRSDAALARLDLARLYARRLEQPRQAIHHLAQFVSEYPSDPAAPSARRQMCTIAASLGVDELGCDAVAD